MAGIIGIIAFLSVLGLSLIITQVATIALTMTGLSQEAAKFQARSAFTGTGFTTNEAEEVVNHPVRRRIIMILMVLRSAGLVTIIISLILSFVGPGGSINRLSRLGTILIGIFVLWLLTKSNLLKKYLSFAIQWALRKWTNLDTRDYLSLLRLTGPYTIMELKLKEGDWLVGKKVSECSLRQEGITILGITREDGSYVGVPQPGTEFYPNDNLVLYGRSEGLQELDKRKADFQGDREHQKAMDKQQEEVRQQNRREEKSKRKREVKEQMEKNEQQD